MPARGLSFHSNDAKGVVSGASPRQAQPRATGAEVGSTFKPRPALVVNAALWYLHLRDELVYSGDEGTTESVGATQHFGLDVSVRYQLTPRLFLDADANYSYGRLLARPAGDNLSPPSLASASPGGSPAAWAPACATATSTAARRPKTTACAPGATSCLMPCSATPVRAIKWTLACKTY